MKTELTPELNWPEERYRLQWILFDRGYLLGDAEVSGWLWSHDRVVHVLGAEPEGLMLGSWFGQPVAVAEVDEASIKAASIKATRRVALRSALLASPMQQALLARAAQVLRFDRDHRFCSRCGRQLECCSMNLPVVARIANWITIHAFIPVSLCWLRKAP